MSKKIKEKEEKNVNLVPKKSKFTEIKTIKDIENKLNNDEKIIFGDLSKEDKDLINSLNLITLKPLFYICNVDEQDASTGNKYSKLVEEIYF